jgi:hypothetical protein
LGFLDTRISLFNHIFPDTPYKLLGFTRDQGGKFRFVVTQPFIDTHGISEAEVDAYMKAGGFEKMGRESYGNKLYQVHDIHEKNAAKDANGTIYVIDAVPKMASDDLYQPFEVRGVDTELAKSIPAQDQTETPEFKRWFGDWNLMRKETEVVTAPRHSFANLTEANQWARRNIVGSYRNTDTGNEITISGNAIDKYLSEKAVNKSSSMPYHLATLRVLPDLIHNAVLAESHVDTSGNPRVSEVQRYYAAVSIDGNLRRVKLTVKVLDTGERRNYTYEVTEIETLGGPLAVSVEAEASNRTPSVSMATLLQGARKNNGDAIDTKVSKVVDENGKPLVVYHGTPHDFSSFDPEESGDGGLYFTDEPRSASGYAAYDWSGAPQAGQVMPVYLRITNPLVVDFQGFDFSGNGEEGDRLYVPSMEQVLETARAQGNDGVIAQNVRDSRSTKTYGGPQTTYIVFSDKQIKSAIGNDGNFDPDDADITKSIPSDTELTKAVSDSGVYYVIFDDADVEIEDIMLRKADELAQAREDIANARTVPNRELLNRVDPANLDRLYDFGLTELVKPAGVSDEVSVTSSSLRPAAGSTPSRLLQKLLDFNQKVSKVVDENGEPLVVYHGYPLARRSGDPEEWNPGSSPYRKVNFTSLPQPLHTSPSALLRLPPPPALC